jgi:hypothetical protein
MRVEAEGHSALSAPQEPILVDLVEPTDSLLRSDGLEDVLAILGRSVGEIFPANRVSMRCSKCGAGIPRFEGYRHIKTGDKRTFCESCHRAMGLPLREAVGGAHRESTGLVSTL